ncbi:penicillin-binding protein 2 [Planctomicrobium sp.]|nr:penicillin-binding protein 2 [Planctomicrobium sp.]MDB4742918.1 penicillin-binding protein 2 [Planctomicrobium sp.]
MTSEAPLVKNRRSRFVQLCVLVIWSVLAARLLHVQYFSQEVFASRALRQQVSHETISARPGDILDRKGRLLATTISVPSLYVNPSRISEPSQVAAKLSEVFELDEQKFISKIEKNRKRQFLWIKRHLTPEQGEMILKLGLPKDQVHLRQEFKRFYPQDSLAAHVIGLRDIDGIGRGGAEQSFNKYLTGTDGKRQFVRDARGNVLEILEEVTQPPENGKTVALTIDTVLQLHTEQALDELLVEHNPVGVCAIVLDPNNGEILAMASRPAFHPDHAGSATSGAWKNLAISAVYEPGSTFKPLVVGWGLDRGLLKHDEKFHCEWGKYQMGRRLLHDHHPYGDLGLVDVLVKSSNIGMAKIGERLGNEQLFSMATSFGFGKKTGVELAGEVAGLLRPLRAWDGYSTGSIPMGHELAVTPLQMISAHAILANGGRKISPHLLLKTNHKTPQPQQVVVSRIINSKVAKWVVENPMLEVVERGTGKKAQLENYSVFGKTGTAQKVNPNGGYYSNKNVCSFICGAPAEKPRILVLVCVDEPRGSSQFGGTVAAPVASKILEKCLKTLGE